MGDRGGWGECDGEDAGMKLREARKRGTTREKRREGRVWRRRREEKLKSKVKRVRKLR